VNSSFSSARSEVVNEDLPVIMKLDYIKNGREQAYLPMSISNQDITPNNYNFNISSNYSSKNLIKYESDNVLNKNLNNLNKYEVSNEFITYNAVEFVNGEEIAKGTFGTIYSGLSKNTGAIVAIKRVGVQNKSIQKLIKLEIKKLSKIEHPNLLKYIGVQCNSESNNEELEIISEYCNGGSVKQLLDKFDIFEENLIKNYVKQVLEALLHLHDHNISHNNLKNTNILVDGEGQVKLNYFNLEQYFPKENKIPTDKAIDNKNSSNIL